IAEAFGGRFQRPAVGIVGQAAAYQAIELVVIDALAHRQERPAELGCVQSDRGGESRRCGGTVVAPGVDLDAFEVVSRRCHCRAPLTSANAGMASTRREPSSRRQKRIAGQPGPAAAPPGRTRQVAGTAGPSGGSSVMSILTL